VRIAVAKFESTPVTPIFARTAVAPAKRAEDFVVALKNGSRLPLQGESEGKPNCGLGLRSVGFRGEIDPGSEPDILLCHDCATNLS
jgi:hypothetical protein